MRQLLETAKGILAASRAGNVGNGNANDVLPDVAGVPGWKGNMDHGAPIWPGN